MRNVGIIVTHNIQSSLRTTFSDTNLILSKAVTKPKILKTPNTQFHYKLLTVQNPANSSIETRAKRIQEQIELLTSQKKLDAFHLVSSSLSGLDARFMIGNNSQMNRMCETLVTVNSPNQGSHFVNLYMSGKISENLMNRIGMVLGVSPESLGECSLSLIHI